MKEATSSGAGGTRSKASARGWDGRQLRELRKARGVTLKELSRKSDVSIGMLSQLERGISSPSIRSLKAISAALEIPASWFFRDGHNVAPRERGIIVRRGDGRLLSFEDDFRKELITPDLSGALEAMLVVIKPGGSSGPEPYNHRGEELGHVLAGVLDLWIDEQHFRLQAGDTFRFASERMHRFANGGNTETRVLWVVTPPFY